MVRINVTGRRGSCSGSGFVVDKRGTVVTNFHVIESADQAEVVFQDGTTADVRGYLCVAPKKDLAILRVECPADKLHPLPVASSLPRKGNQVLAFGSPLGVSRSVSDGIISAIRHGTEIKALGMDLDGKWIQTTAPISRGNSGGPLVNMAGEVVGVNTRTLAPAGGQNITFAVSAVDTKEVLDASGEDITPLVSLHEPQAKPPVRSVQEPQVKPPVRPQFVDLTGTFEGKTLSRNVRKMILFVSVTGVPTWSNAEYWVKQAAKNSLSGAGLQIVEEASPGVAARVVLVQFRSYIFRPEDKGSGNMNMEFLIEASSFQKVATSGSR